MSVKNKCHVMAIMEIFEAMTIAFTLALIGDLIWVIWDIIEDGICIKLITVTSILFFALVIIIKGLIKYHRENVLQFRKALYYSKMNSLKYKQKKINKRMRHNK